MKYSGLYFISNPTTSLDASLNTVNTLVQQIENSFPTATRQTPWSLQYQMFRDTIPPGASSTDAEGKPKQFAHTLQHFLHLSSLHKDRTYICIKPPVGASTVNAIPLGQQDARVSLVRHQFAALWQPRHVLSLKEGATYTIGLFTVQIGELQAHREGPQSGGIQSPGVVVCITTMVGEEDSLNDSTKAMSPSFEEGDDDVDFDYAQTIIRECWSNIKQGRDLGKSEVREVMMAPEYLKGTKEKDAAVQMWWFLHPCRDQSETNELNNKALFEISNNDREASPAAGEPDDATIKHGTDDRIKVAASKPDNGFPSIESEKYIKVGVIEQAARDAEARKIQETKKKCSLAFVM